jgi:hypothetical protein
LGGVFWRNLIQQVQEQIICRSTNPDRTLVAAYQLDPVLFGGRLMTNRVNYFRLSFISWLQSIWGKEADQV